MTSTDSCTHQTIYTCPALADVLERLAIADVATAQTLLANSPETYTFLPADPAEEPALA